MQYATSATTLPQLVKEIADTIRTRANAQERLMHIARTNSMRNMYEQCAHQMRELADDIARIRFEA